MLTRLAVQNGEENQKNKEEVCGSSPCASFFILWEGGENMNIKKCVKELKDKINVAMTNPLTRLSSRFFIQACGLLYTVTNTNKDHFICIHDDQIIFIDR